MEHFIETVKQFPILWNTEAKDYRDSNKRDAIWKRIVEEINNSDIPDINTAKHEWKKVRDSHRESLKRIKVSTNGQANNWKYAGLLEFLLPYMKNRKRAVSTQEIEDVLLYTSTEDKTNRILEDIQHDTLTQIIQSQSDDSNCSEQIIQPRQKKKKVDGVKMRRCKQRDKRRAEEVREWRKNRHPLNLFFDSMCESTKKLPDRIQRDVKKKLLSLVNEAEESHENYLSGQQCQCTSSSAHSTPQAQEHNFYD